MDTKMALKLATEQDISFIEAFKRLSKDSQDIEAQKSKNRSETPENPGCSIASAPTELYKRLAESDELSASVGRKVDMTTAIVDSLQSNERNLEAKLDQIMAEISGFKHDLTVQLNEIKSQFETRLEKEIQNAKRQAKQLIFDEIMSHKSQIIKNDLSHDKTMRKEIVQQVT